MKPVVRSLLLLSAFLLPACGSSSDPGTTGTGEVTLTLTDAATDDIEVFEVDVSDVVFTKLDGSQVSLLTRAARVDFTQLETLAEMIVGSGLEAGVYTGLTLTLDFSNAVVRIQGSSSAATVLDKDGNPLTGTLPVEVTFTGLARPRIVVGRHHLYVLDLDLDQALSVDPGANTVTFCPAISASIDPSNPKPVATTGILSSVDLIANTFTLERRALNGSVIGTFTVRASGLTAFQIDGQVTLGAMGLLNLSAQTLGTARVFVQGAVDRNARILNAAAVEAGAGTPGNGQDWVLGHVVARDNSAGSDATLTVLGRSVDASSGTRTFNTLHTVDVMLGNTKVLRRAAGNSLTTDAIGIGQLVMVFGDLTGTSLNATATDAVARLLRTSIYGIASGSPAGNVLTLDVTRFDLRDISRFNFDVGGTIESDPDAYTVDVTGLNTTGITNGAKIRAFGWVNPVGVSGDADFDALSLVNHTAEAKLLFCQWLPANASALAGISDTELTLDVSAALIKSVGDGFGPVALTETPAPTVAPLLNAGVYRIVQRGGVQLHFAFDSFAQELEARMNAGARVFRVAALGTFDQPTQAFQGLVVTVILN